MNKITLYLDMDGVLANFDKKFQELKTLYEHDEEDHVRFRDAVMKYNIFEDLEYMPDANVLLNHVSKLRNVNIEILTSKGTFDVVRGEAAQEQKLIWLKKKNIPYKPNFVRTKTEKAKFATPYSILIDDSIGCITPFNNAGGHGILHSNDSVKQTLFELDRIIEKLTNEYILS